MYAVASSKNKTPTDQNELDVEQHEDGSKQIQTGQAKGKEFKCPLC